MINFKEFLEEGGLWANIHAKRKRIKNGSSERMRKPGSKGAPSDADFKSANEEVVKEANFADTMKKAIDAHERGDHKKAAYHLDNAKTARYAMKSTEISKHKDLLDKYKELRSMHESVEEQFDLIEEVIEQLAEEQGINSEAIWETLESLDDIELLEYAVDAKGHKSSTGGLTQKGRDSYNAKGGNLQAPVTTPPSKLKPGSKAANRRKSFCARMGGMEGAMKKPNGEPTRKALALRKWNC